MPDFILAIDGGQSSTACMVGLTDGTLLSSGHGGPAAVPGAAQSVNLMRAALTACVNEALDGITPRPHSVRATYLGLTGGTQAALDILPTLIQTQMILAEGDAAASLACGTYGGPGMAIISGTGCVAYAKNSHGEETVRGGWGYLLGDEGSGFWIGLQAVRAAVRAEDGRGPRTPFTGQVMRQLLVADMREAQHQIYNEQITRPDVARLTLLVMDAAEEGDEIAGSILDQASRELYSLVEATSRAAGLVEDAERVIVASGGVLRPNRPVFRLLAAQVGHGLPTFRLISPRVPPVAGAFILGMMLAGAAVDSSAIHRIEETLAGLPQQQLKA